MKKPLFYYIKKILPFIGITLLILYIIYNLNVNDIKDALFSIHPIYVVLALTLTIPRVLIRNLAWQCILKEQQIDIGYWASLKIFLIGYFYGSFTPGYMGQLMRIPYIKEKTNEPYGKLFVNSTIETTVHTTSVYIMIFFGSLLILQSFPDLFLLIIIWLIVLATTVFIFIKKERGLTILNTLIKYFIPKKKKKPLYEFVSTFYHHFPKVRKLILPGILGSFTWIIIFSQEYIFVYALGLDIPYLYFILLFPIANAAGFIPITFAGIGTREITAIVIFTTLFASVSGEQILVVSLLGFFITDICTGIVGFFLSLTETRTNINDCIKPKKTA